LSVEDATQLFRNARTGYIDVLLAQRDLFDARRVLIDTKREQLSAIVNTYQALGGGAYLSPVPKPEVMQPHLQHHRWKHFWHAYPSAAGGGPRGRLQPRGAGGPPARAAEGPRAPAADGPPTPPADGPPVPPPTPPAATSLEPLPTPTGGGNG